MDRIEKPKPPRSEFAKQGEMPRTDPVASDTPTGREDHLGLAEAGATAASEVNQPVGAQPRSEVTGSHDAGSGANETADGLTDLEEALRRGAEDTPTGQSRSADDDVPVFDRGDALPKV